MSLMSQTLERLAAAVETNTSLDAPADRLQKLTGKIPAGPLKDALSGTAIGHPLHPMLVTVPIGAVASAIVLDVTDGDRDASRRLIGRVRPAQLLLAGVAMGGVGAAILLGAVLLDASVGVLGLALFLVVASIGLVSPNATALALADHPRNAGAASALLGTSQFLLGAAAAPLVGLAGEHDALPMAVTIACLAAAAAVCALRS